MVVPKKTGRENMSAKYVFGVRGRLYLAFTAVGGLAVISSFIAYLTFQNITSVVDDLTGAKYPPFTEALILSGEAQNVVAQLPMLAGSENIVIQRETAARIEEALKLLTHRVAVMMKEEGSADKRYAGLKGNIEELGKIYLNLNQAVSSRLELNSQLGKTKAELKDFVNNGDALIGQALPNNAENAQKLFGNTITLLRDVLEERDEAMINLWPMRYIVQVMDFESSLEEKTQGGLGKLLSSMKTMGGDMDGSNGVVALRKSILLSDRTIKEILNQAIETGEAVKRNVEVVRENSLLDVTNALKTLDAEIKQANIYMAVLASCGLIIPLLIVVFYVSKRVIVRLKELSSTMSVLASGELNFEMPTYEADEIGDMVMALGVFKENAIERKHAFAERERRKEERALKRVHELEKLAQSIENVMGQALQVVGSEAESVNQMSTEMMQSSQFVNQGITDISQGSESTNQNLHTIASAAEELSRSAQEITMQVEYSSKISESANINALKAGEVALDLKMRTSEIRGVVSLITDIAEQTNLLALNATIEAARAGDAGKGFSVVAGEVKSLSHQTARAVDGIFGNMKAIETAVENVEAMVMGFKDTFGKLTSVSGQISQSAFQQGQATQEISKNVQHTAEVSSSSVSSIRGFKDNAHHSQVLAKSLSEAASNTQDQVKVLREKLLGIVAGIRQEAAMENE
jgi:methyl-accepting chemotaxis protein